MLCTFTDKNGVKIKTRTVKEITRNLQMLNRKGAIMTIYSDGGKAQQAILDSLTPLRAEAGQFWLLWKAAGYPDDNNLCKSIKVVDHLVNAFLEDDNHGKQWLTITLQDDQSNLYLIEIIEPFCEPEAHHTWRKWQSYRKKNRDRLKRLDREILEKHRDAAEYWDEQPQKKASNYEL